MLQDVRFAFRMIVKERWYTAVAVLVIALGIGVNATGFTIVNSAYRGPVFTDTHQLLALSWQTPEGRGSDISHAELLDLGRQTQVFERIAAFTEPDVNIADSQWPPQEVSASALTSILRRGARAVGSWTRI